MAQVKRRKKGGVYNSSSTPVQTVREGENRGQSLTFYSHSILIKMINFILCGSI